MSDLTPIQAVEECIARLEIYHDELVNAGHIIKVKNGDDLQLAHDSCKPGDTLLVQPGTYFGVNVSNSINLVPDATIPSGRLDKNQPGLIALKPRASNQSPLTVPGNMVNIMGVQLYPIPTLSAMSTLSGDSISLDRYLLLGDPLTGQRRGIAAQGSNLKIINGYVDDIFNTDDAQAIMMWDGAGPFFIDNNYLSASGEVVMSGGADSHSGKQPGGLTLTNNYITKKLTWKSPTSKVKNCVELKDMIGAVIKNNTIENSWLDGQTGYLLLITPRNQSGTEPFAQVAHIIIQQNNFKNGAAGVQLLGSDNEHPSQQTIDINILGNSFDRIGINPGDHRCFTFTGVPGVKNCTIRDNKFTNYANINSFLYLDTALENLVFENNEVPEGEYGLKATGGASGIASWNKMVTGGSFANNKIHAGGFRTIYYGGNGNVVIP